MQNFGLILIILGSIGGSLTAVMDKDAVNWTYFLPCLVLGTIGVALVQVAIRRHATSEDTLATNIKDIDDSIVRIASNIAKLDDELVAEDVYELPQKIDALLPHDITKFVDARESLIHVYGLQFYAEVMGVFAAGERYLNRVWSAAAEGYIDEAHTYLKKSREQFSSVHETIKAKLEAASAS